MPRPRLSDPLERLARPFLPKLVQLAAEQGRAPRDYFLLLGKYDSSSSLIVPRAAADGVLALAKTPARRRKYEGLLASPCEPNELLILLCAGDHVEGHWMRVPSLLAEKSPKVDGKTQERMTPEAERYVRVHVGRIVQAIKQKGEKVADWMAILRMPDEVPVVLRRSRAKEPLEMTGFAEEVLQELAKPAPDDELFCVEPSAEGLSWFRVKTSFEVDVAGEGMEAFATRLAQECKESLERVGQKPTDYVAYVRWPPEDGKGVQPIVCARSAAAEELRESKKLDQILEILADPYDGMMLFVDAADREDIFWTCRDDGELQREMDALLGELIGRAGLE